MTDILQGSLNLFVVGLYHLLEQQMLLFYRKELLTLKEAHRLEGLKGQDLNKALSFKRVMERLGNEGISLEKFTSWKNICDLSLIANTVKHADGSACTDLKRRRPDLFVHPMSLHHFSGPIREVFTPLSGDTIYITEKHLEDFIIYVRGFWEELITALSKITDEMP